MRIILIEHITQQYIGNTIRITFSDGSVLPITFQEDTPNGEYYEFEYSIDILDDLAAVKILSDDLVKVHKQLVTLEKLVGNIMMESEWDDHMITSTWMFTDEQIKKLLEVIKV